MDSVVKGRITWFVLFVALAVAFYSVLPIVGPFLLGLGLAYFFRPLLDKLTHTLPPFVSRKTTSFVLVFVLMLLLFGFLLLFLPFVIAQLEQLLKQLPLYIDVLLERFAPYLALLKEQSRMNTWLHSTDTMLTDAARSTVAWAASSLLAILSNTQGLFNILFYLCVTPFVMFHALVGWPSILHTLTDLLPSVVRQKWLQFFSELDRSLMGYIRGQTLVCLAMAIYLACGFALLGLPHGVMLGLLTGLFVFVPYVGMFSGTFMAVVLILVHNPSMAAFIGLILLLAGGQLLEAFLFIPLFVGKRLGMHPVWVLFAIFAAGSILGFWGVLLALPLAIFCHVSLSWSVAFYRETHFFRR